MELQEVIDTLKRENRILAESIVDMHAIFELTCFNHPDKYRCVYCNMTQPITGNSAGAISSINHTKNCVVPKARQILQNYA